MTNTNLGRELVRVDGRPYPAYRDLRGRRYVVASYEIEFDHVQGDPFAAPSRVTVGVPPDLPALPEFARGTPDARRAAGDFLHRRVRRVLGGRRCRSGSGKSGLVEIAALGQEVLDRTALRVGADGTVRLRLTIGLPAAGRRILGRAAATLLCEQLPQALDEALRAPRIPVADLRRHVEAVEDQVAMRSELADHELVAFIAADSLLPRRSGADDRPMSGGLPIDVPPSLCREIRAPHAGLLRGLGIPRGVTLIVGGGYHGKSTLLSSIARGVYDHIPGDGRERCVTSFGAVGIRAEDGRSVRGVDLRPFIGDLPLGRLTSRFDTDDASGSTSQAAAIVEALEIGADALLIDEDTAATNFMIRDPRMRRLVPAAKEPITPYLDRVRQLHVEQGVSSVLVVGGAGDYLDVADLVVQMDEYQPRDVTDDARAVAAALPLEKAGGAPPAWQPAAGRVPDPASLDPSRGRRAERVRSVRTRSIEFGTEEIDVALLGQLIDPGQCRMIGDVLLGMSRGWCDGTRTVGEILDLVDGLIDESGLDGVAARGFGDRARARRFEVAAALNRLRGLRVR